MDKKPKYYNKKLTDEDTKILERAAFKLVMKLYSQLEKYSDAKYMAKFLKKFRSTKNSALLYTLMYTSMLPVGQTFQPKMLNQRLLSDMRSSIEQDHIDAPENEGQLLHPRDLRERVLKILQEWGII